MSTVDPSGHAPALIDLRSIWRQRLLVIACILAALGLGAVYLRISTPEYQVAARLLVENRGQPMQADALPEKGFLPTQAEIIRSPKVLSVAVADLGLPPQTPTGGSQVVSVLKQLQVEPLVGTDVLSVEYTHEDPDLAIQTVHAIVDGYKKYLQETEQTAHRETIAILVTREQMLRKQMSALRSDYENLRTTSPLMGQDRDAAGVQRALLTTLGESLATNRRQQIELRNDLETFTRKGNKLLTAKSKPDSATDRPTRDTTVAFEDFRPSIDALSRLARDGTLRVDDPTPIQSALLAARSRGVELSTRFGPKHPEVKGVQRMIESLESRLIEMVHAAPQLWEQELASLERKEVSLEELYHEEFNEAKRVDAFLVKESQILDEIQSVQTTHDTILGQLNTLELADRAVTEGRASVTVSVLDGPELVDALGWPQPTPLLGLCGLIGLGTGIVLAAMRHQLTQVPAVSPPASAAVHT